MATEWKEVKIGDYSKITDYVANGSFASLASHVQYKIEPDSTVLIRLVDYHNNFKGDFVYIDDDAYEFLSKSKLMGGEIIISNVGANTGTVFKCPKLPYKMSLAPNSIMVKTFGYDDFYYYWFKSPQGQGAIKSIITGSAQPKFNKTNFKQIVVPVPPLEEQQKIAKILSSLDEKIELNNKINENLHAQAQAIFKSWFVDFEPFGGTMPNDWEEKSLVQLADFVNGLAMQRFRPKENEKALPVLKIRELRLGDCDSSSELCSSTVKQEYIVNQGDIIFSWSGSLLVDVWSGKQCGLNQHLFNVKPKEFYGKWFVFLWVQYHLDNFIAIANDKATTMGHIKREHLEKAKVFVPAQKAYQQLDNLLNPILEYSLNLWIENKKLAQIRDTLLPKLMSEELEV